MITFMLMLFLIISHFCILCSKLVSIKKIKGWWKEIAGECRLLQANDEHDVTRLSAEFFLEIGAFLYIIAALREAQFLGLNMFIENLVRGIKIVIYKI